MEDKSKWNVYDYKTGDYLRPASEEDLRLHNEKADKQGLFVMDGRTVFVW